jgi:fatty aldehyde-generating acyl-ACP reductase
MTPKKFAFLVHLRSSYKTDLALMAKPFGLVPDKVYDFLMSGRPFNPFVWSEVTLTPGAAEPEGYIIMLPYTGKQLLSQQRQMQPLVQKALKLAHTKGAEIMGLGALTSPITLGGKTVAGNPYASITNGNAYTAVITYQKMAKLINKNMTVAIVGASGSVGTLVCNLLAKNNCQANYTLIARNQRRLTATAAEMKILNSDIQVQTSTKIADCKNADIVLLLTSAGDCLLKSEHLKQHAIVLDDTQPRNTSPDLLIQRPDITIIDGGLVSVPELKFLQRGICLPKGISFACLAETMLLAQAGYTENFSVGNPTLEQAEYILEKAAEFKHLGFGLAQDHCFGKPVFKTTVTNIKEQYEQILNVA